MGCRALTGPSRPFTGSVNGCCGREYDPEVLDHDLG